CRVFERHARAPGHPVAGEHLRWTEHDGGEEAGRQPDDGAAPDGGLEPGVDVPEEFSGELPNRFLPCRHEASFPQLKQVSGPVRVPTDPREMIGDDSSDPRLRTPTPS